MKKSKSSVVLKSGKTKSPSAAPDKEQFVAFKQKIKDAKLHLQGIKRALRDAKDAVKRAKLDYKSARKSAVKSPAKQADKKPVKAKPVKQPVKSVAQSRSAARKPIGGKQPVARKAVAAKPAVKKVLEPAKPVRTPAVQARPKPKPAAQPKPAASTPVVRKRNPRSKTPTAIDASVETSAVPNPEPTVT